MSLLNNQIVRVSSKVMDESKSRIIQKKRLLVGALEALHRDLKPSNVSKITLKIPYFVSPV